MKLNLRNVRQMISTMVTAATADLVKQEDIASIRQMEEQFAGELATTRGRVDGLEAQLAAKDRELSELKNFIQGQIVPPGDSESPNVLEFMRQLKFYRESAITREDLGQFLYLYKAFDEEQRTNRYRHDRENPVESSNENPVESNDV